MEPISTILSTALGYILKGAANSKAAEKAKDELLGGFWQWLRPLFIEDVPDIENPADIAKTEQKANTRLIELIENDEQFFETLLEKIELLKKASIKEKNIVNGDIKSVKKIKIGDKTYAPHEVYNRKNIVKGNIEDADEFILGDGH